MKEAGACRSNITVGLLVRAYKVLKVSTFPFVKANIVTCAQFSVSSVPRSLFGRSVFIFITYTQGS
jgi:hypothetical protein